MGKKRTPSIVKGLTKPEAPVYLLLGHLIKYQMIDLINKAFYLLPIGYLLNMSFRFSNCSYA